VGGSYEVFLFFLFFQCSFIRCIVKWVGNMVLLLGPILYLHPSSVQGGVGDITHSLSNSFS
jgi:hypothetical protein